MSGREADKARERAGATGAGVAPRVGEVRRLVVKIGSSTLTTSESTIDYAYLNRMADQIARVREAGWRPVIVTSAAIACGLEALGIVERPHDMPSLQAAASVGQGALSAAYAQAFARHGLLTSVVLLTRRDTADRTAYLHARDTLLRLLELGVVPVVNENDTVSVEQIRFGDNDTLAALVACLIDADLMVILSDIDGLYDANPHRVEGARLIGRVERIDQAVIGSCTNGRIADMRQAADVLRGRKVHPDVRCIVIPATQQVYRQCMEEGLMEVFLDANCAVSTPTCGPCLGGYMGILAAGERAIATTNRNFVGRMGDPTSEVYLSSPAVAAASAVLGHIGLPEDLD